MTIDIKRVLQEFSTAGYILEDEAYELLNLIDNDTIIQTLIRDVLNELETVTPKPVSISKEILERIALKQKLIMKEEKKSSSSRSFKPIANDVNSDIKVIFDPTENIGSEGSLEDFNNYFKTRFIKISKILKERYDVRDTTTINEALKSNKNSVKFIAMISEKREREGKVFLQVEDLTNTATVLATKPNVYNSVQKVLLDQVVCIEAFKTKKDLFILENIIFPDLPERKIQVRDDPLKILALSDIHFGSKTFRNDLFEHLVFWLNGKIGNQKQREIVGSIKYVVISGDLVDGIGIYPNQDKELELLDIYEQYRLLSQFIEQIPEYIEVIILPGNHDATRQALPQPAIPKEYAEPVYEARNVISIGNPSNIKINERSILLFHGTSLNDIIASIPGLHYSNLKVGIESLLKARHLAPSYGGVTSIAPEEEDYLVLEEPPEIFQSGHIHIEGHGYYRGTLIVSCAAWQDQTEYQRKMGLEPTVGVGSLISLKDLNLRLLDFSKNA